MPPSCNVALRSRHLCIVDRIYDNILLPPLVTRVLDTPEVQRLRSLHQLGNSNYVFPTATHTRFEHSIGVAFMAGRMISYWRQQQPELGLTERDELCGMLAGLLHDVGHGPFSHLFEDVIASKCAIPGGFSHEDMSDRLARRALQRTLGDGLLEAAELDLVIGLMHGRAPHNVPYRDVIANHNGGIDVDRMDYLTRDCIMCFGRPALDTRVNRLLFSCRLCYEEGKGGVGLPGKNDGEGRWEMGFEAKMALSLHELFALRAKLHRSVYQHPVTKAIGHMIGDIFELAAPYFKVDGTHTILDCVQEEELFLKLGDWILPAIAAQSSAHTTPQLRAAMVLVHRLQSRDIYHKVFSRTLRLVLEKEWLQVDWKGRILDCIPPVERKTISPDDFIVDVVHVHHGKGKRNPVEDILFFNPKKPELKPMRLVPFASTAPQQTFSSESDSLHSPFSSLLFEEHTIFVFERRDTGGVLGKACAAMASDPSLRHLFVQHEIPFQN